MPAAQRHFLFVGGPFGPFFRKLGNLLKSTGCTVTHVSMQGGDLLDWGWRDAVTYRKGQAEWADWIGGLLDVRQVTDIVTYGDCGEYARLALAEAKRRHVARHVFELGYFRPDWVTLERDGINGYSSLREFPKSRWDECPNTVGKEPVGRIMPFHVAYTIAHCLAHYAGWALFPRFKASWPESPLKQAIGYVSGLAVDHLTRRKVRQAERDVLESTDPFFLCALQKPGDSQLRFHSPFKTLAPLIRHVVASFARAAPANARLVFKAHPLDNGMESPEEAVRAAAREYGVAERRLIFLPSGSLSALTQKAVGVVTVNSTAGLAALDLGRPTITLGRAFYDIEGLTHRSGLDRFWTAPEPPDRKLFARFRAMVMARTQINGNYYAPRGRRMVLPEAARRLLASPPDRLPPKRS